MALLTKTALVQSLPTRLSLLFIKLRCFRLQNYRLPCLVHLFECCLKYKPLHHMSNANFERTYNQVEHRMKERDESPSALGSTIVNSMMHLRSVPIQEDCEVHPIHTGHPSHRATTGSRCFLSQLRVNHEILRTCHIQPREKVGARFASLSLPNEIDQRA